MRCVHSASPAVVSPAVVVVAVLAVLAALAVGPAAAVDRSKFRTCGHRVLQRYRDHKPSSHFHVDVSTLDRTHPHRATAVLGGGPRGSIPLDLTLHFYASGVARVRVTEAKTRWQPPDVVLEDQMAPTTYTYKEGDGHVTFFYAKESSSAGDGGGAKAVRLHYNPFKVDMLIDGEIVMTANERNLFHFEHTRLKDGTVVTDSMSAKAGAVAEETRRLAEEAGQAARRLRREDRRLQRAWPRDLRGWNDKRRRGQGQSSGRSGGQS